MDIQLKELIEKIETEGVQAAEQKAESILAEARSKADTLISDAKKERDRIIMSAKNEADKLDRTGKEALFQASRDLVLDLQARIIKIFKSVVEKETASAMTEEVLSEAVIQVVKGWAAGSSDKLEVLLNPEQLHAVEDFLSQKLAEQLKSGLMIKPFSQIESGFRVVEKDGAAYYNFTAEGISEILFEYLNPRIAEILKVQDK